MELCNSTIGNNFIYLDQTTSTMDISRKYSNDSRNDGVVVFAEHQTKARGRLGRDWISQQNQNIGPQYHRKHLLLLYLQDKTEIPLPQLHLSYKYPECLKMALLASFLITINWL